MTFDLRCAVAQEVISLTAGDAITITQMDGKIVSGKIVKSDGESLFIELPDGDVRPISKKSIQHLRKGATAAAPSQRGRSDTKQLTPPTDPTISALDDSENMHALAAEFQALGADTPEKRAVAYDRVKELKSQAVPVLIGMLHPKSTTPEFTRIGALRALESIAPLPEKGAVALAYVSVFDPFPEVRRESCNVIRRLGDDRSMRELMKYAAAENPPLRRAAGIALHEIDDTRVYASVINSIPTPSVTANQGEVGGLDKPKYVLPSGPGGLNVPIYLPTQDVSGVAAGIGSPAADLLKVIAGKDMGNLPYPWLMWYREKVGDITTEDREEARRNRSLRGRMGSPPSGTTGP